MLDDLQYLIDENGHRYEIEEELGRGAQGVVYKLKDSNLVAKVKLNVKDFKKFKDDINYLDTLNIPENTKIIRPLYFLKSPYCGYIMSLVDNMIPLTKIIKPFDGEDPKQFYLKTGGLKKRLEILKNLSYTLEVLRSLSIVYADLSPYNIYVSEDIDKFNIRLIDPDNMRYTIDFNNSIFTPDYGAPEVVSGIRSNDTFSDNYSFALIAFELLSFAMPFCGSLVINDDWANDGLSMEERARRGELPWILDEDDTSNSLDINYFPDKFQYCPSNLKKLFHKTFSLEGRNDPDSRTNMREWYFELKRALDRLYICRKCGASFHYKLDTCPFCNQKRDKVFVLYSYKIINIDKLISPENKTDQKLRVHLSQEIANRAEETKKIRVLNNLSFNGLPEDIIDICNDDTHFIKFSEDRDVLVEFTKVSDDKYHYKKVSDKVNLYYVDNNGELEEVKSKEVKNRPSLENQTFYLFFKSLSSDDNTSALDDDNSIFNSDVFYKFMIKLV